MAGRQPPDAELVRRALEGDRSALAGLVQRHRPTAEALCVRLLGRPDLAEDAVQEAIVVAMVGLHRLRRADRFGPWLCGIALNVARRWLRAAGRAPADSSREIVDDRPGPEDVALTGDEAARVRAAVAALPSGQREAATLYYLDDRSGLEAAAVLAISTTALKTRLHKARRALRSSLAEAEVDTVTEPIEMHVAEVRREPAATKPMRHAIVLEDETGRRLPIFVGEPEAVAVALRLQGTDLPRPMTHMLLVDVIDALDARVAEVRVTRLAEATFFGEIDLVGPSGRVTVDARPSDAINVAMLAGAPIRVDADVLRAVETGSRRATDLEALTEDSRQIADEFRSTLADLMRSLAQEP